MKITTTQLRQMIREELQKQKTQINENIDPATAALLIQVGTLVGGALGAAAAFYKASSNLSMDDRSMVQKVKDWWKSRKDTAAIEAIVKRLNKDPEVVEFVKNKNKTGWRELLKKKLTGNEVEYINKVYRTRIKGEEQK
jgi:hypothetical protein